MSLQVIAKELSASGVRHAIVTAKSADPKTAQTSQDGFTDPHGLHGLPLFRPALDPDLAAALKSIPEMIRFGTASALAKHVTLHVYPVIGGKREKYAELAKKVKEFRARYAKFYTDAIHKSAEEKGVEPRVGRDKTLDAVFMYIRSLIRNIDRLAESLTKLARLRRVPAPVAKSAKTAVAAAGSVNNIGVEGKKILKFLQAQHHHGSSEKIVKEFAAGRAWLDLKKIPKPVDNSFELCRKLGLIKGTGRGESRKFTITSDGVAVLNQSAEATASNDIADVRRVRDNKLVRSLRDEISNDKLNNQAGAFIKELVRIASEEKLRSGEECYIYWRNTKYLPDYRNQTLKSAGSGARRFVESY